MRELKLVKIKFISLVPRIKNRLPKRFKGSGIVEIKNLVINHGGGLLTVLIFDPKDGYTDDCMVAPGLLRNMAYEYMRGGANIDTRHNGHAISKKRAAVVESYFIHEDDPRYRDLTDYEGHPVDATGAWAVVIRIQDKDLLALYRDPNSWNGVSIFGEAVYTKKSALASVGKNGNGVRRKKQALTESLIEEAEAEDALCEEGAEEPVVHCGPVVDGRIGYGLPWQQDGMQK
jgi:hypothetical protein